MSTPAPYPPSGGGTDPGALQKAQNLADVPDIGQARENLGVYTNQYATAGYVTTSVQPGFTPTGQIGAYMCDCAKPSGAGVALTAAMAAGDTYPVLPVAAPKWPCMIRIALSNDWSADADVSFVVASQSDFSYYSALYTVRANTPGGTVLTFRSDVGLIPIAELLAVSCTPPPGWTAGTATIQTDAAVQILPVYYYSDGDATCTVQAEYVDDVVGTVGTVLRAALGDGVRPLYVPHEAMDGAKRLRILVRIDDKPRGTVANHNHVQQAD